MEPVPRVYLVASDDAFLHRGQQLLKDEALQTMPVESTEDFFAKVDSSLPGCVLIDHDSLPGGGIVVQEQLHNECAILRCIFAVAKLDMTSAIHLMNLGTAVLMPKPFVDERFIEEVRGAVYLSQLQWQERAQSKAVHERLSQLTEEELQVMELMLTGSSIRETEEQLVMSRRTVNRRRKSVMEKMSVDSVAKLCLIVGKNLPEGMLIRTDPPESGISPSSY